MLYEARQLSNNIYKNITHHLIFQVFSKLILIFQKKTFGIYRLSTTAAESISDQPLTEKVGQLGQVPAIPFPNWNII